MSKPRHRQIEEEIVKRLGGKVHANSGAMTKKHDGSTTEFLIEVKITESLSYTIKKLYWQQLNEKALLRDLDPIMVVDIQGKQLVIIDLDLFESLIQ